MVRFNRESELELMSEWPELYSTNLDPAQAIQMYRRASGEAITVFNRYSGVVPLLQ